MTKVEEGMVAKCKTRFWAKWKATKALDDCLELLVVCDREFI